MAKASTGSVTAKQAKPGAAELPARKKAIAVSAAKPAASTRAGSKKSAPRQAAAKPTAAKRLRTSGKTPAAKAAPKRRVSGQATRPAGAAKRATALRATPAKSGAAKKMAAAKRASGKTAAARIVAAKSVASKTATPRRTPAKSPAPAPAARRTRSAGSPKRAQPPSPATARPPQSFTVNHLNEADFKADGLRTYAQYRDLGIAAATAGLCQAHVIRFVPPCTDEVRKRHRHAADLQLVYVLQGWVKNEFEGVGEQMMSTGTCWLQPSGIEHTVLDYSADCEVLEIVVPADFSTEEID
jgi:hypothetical protein